MLISIDEINKSLANKGWVYQNKNIYKEYQFDSFLDSIDFVNQIARIAETNNHHPEININMYKVRIFISSHEIGGVTTKCVNLAMSIDLIKS